MGGAPMTIPLWLAQVMVGALLAQFIAVGIWMFRQDKSRAVWEEQTGGAIKALSEKLDSISKLLEQHNPLLTARDAEALEKRVQTLESGQKAHHRLLRRHQRRMDRGNVPDLGDRGDDPDGADDGG